MHYGQNFQWLSKYCDCRLKSVKILVPLQWISSRAGLKSLFLFQRDFNKEISTQKATKHPVVWSRQTFWFRLILLLPKHEISLIKNMNMYFLRQFQIFSQGFACKIVVENTLKYSQLIPSKHNKKILLTTRNFRLDSDNKLRLILMLKIFHLLSMEKSPIIFGQILKNPTILLHTGFMLWSDMYHSALATVSLISICSSWSN